MTQSELIYTIKNIIAPVDKTSRYHPEQIKMICDVVYAQRMTSFSEEVMKNVDLFTKEYTSQVCTLDATKNIYSVTIPAKTIPLPKIPSGIRYINLDASFDLYFVPSTEQEQSYMGGLDTQAIDTNINYWVQGEKIWFNESMTAAIAAAGVRIVLVPRFAEYASTDTINIPGGTDYDFIKQVLELLGVTSPVDMKANNANS
jgi:hypothetical protein